MASPRDFINPKTGKPDDRAWLEDQIITLITLRVAEPGYDSLAESAIYVTLAPIDGWIRSEGRPSWRAKNRRTKRAMLAAALRRLIADGKIRVSAEYSADVRSMHGRVRANLKGDRHLFGNDWDGRSRYYDTTNILDALVKALSKE